MHTILVTGFTPFGGQKQNPSWEAVKALPDRINGVTIQKALLPVIYEDAALALMAQLKRFHPHLLLSVGQAGGSSGVRVERAALNVMDANAPDNSGRRCAGEPIRSEGPGGYLSTLDTVGLCQAIAATGIPVEISYHAGTYVCNCVFYTGLHAAATQYPGMKVGFLHLPYMEGQSVPENAAAFPLKQLEKALWAAAVFLLQKILKFPSNKNYFDRQ